MEKKIQFQEGLNREQIEFLIKHKIHPRYVFDGKGMKTSEYGPVMKELFKGVVFNVSACRESGHTLRTRKGHCC